MQTAYSLSPTIGRVGALADVAVKDAIARVASVAIPAGCMATRDASDVKVKLPTSAAEVLAAIKSGGVAVATHAMVSDPSVTVPTFPIGKEVALLRKGRIYVLVEEAVTQGDKAYVRFANGVADTGLVQKGAFRKSADPSAAVAQVATLTPTAANTTSYQVVVKNSAGVVLAIGTYVSDGDATAAEIVAGLKASLGTIPGIAQSGTDTLILTASTAGEAFSVESEGPGVIAVAATTANVTGTPTAAEAVGCFFASSAAAGALAVLEVNLGGN